MAAGQSIADFRRINPEYRIANVVRNGESLGASPTLVMKKGDVIALGGPTSALTDKMGLIGPEVADQNALNVPLDQADILVTNKKYIGRGAGDLSSGTRGRPGSAGALRTRRRPIPGRD